MKAAVVPLAEAYERDRGTPETDDAPLWPTLADELQRVARGVAGSKMVEVFISDDHSHQVAGSDLISIGRYSGATKTSLGGLSEWLAMLRAHTVHETAHWLYTPRLPDYEEPRQRDALNLLEDGRIERRLVEEHPETIDWLYWNIWATRDTETLLHLANHHGWAREVIAVGTRVSAGVLDEEDLDRVVKLADGAVAYIEQLRSTWERYMRLDNDELNDLEYVVEPISEAIRLV